MNLLGNTLKMNLLILFLPLTLNAEPISHFSASARHEFMQIAAETSKDKGALYELGTMHYYGVKEEATNSMYLKENKGEAFLYFKKSYEEGNKDAAPFLAHMHFFGEGTDENNKEALKYFKEVLNSDDEDEIKKANQILLDHKKIFQKISPAFFTTHPEIFNNGTTRNTPLKNTQQNDHPHSSTFKEKLDGIHNLNSDNKNPPFEIYNPPNPPNPLNPNPLNPPHSQSIQLDGIHNLNSDNKNPPFEIYNPLNPLNPNLHNPPALPDVQITVQKFNIFKKRTSSFLDHQVNELSNISSETLSETIKVDIKHWSIEVQKYKNLLNNKDSASPKELKNIKEQLMKLLNNWPFKNILRGVVVRPTHSGSGNGFLYSSKFIVTNYHVISVIEGVEDKAEVGQSVGIYFRNKQIKSATVIYYDCDLDLALLEIKGEPLKQRDLFLTDELNYFKTLWEGGLFTKEEVTSILDSILSVVPLATDLTANFSDKKPAEYLKKDLTKIEKGTIISLKDSFGAIAGSEISTGYSGGAFFYKDQVACIISARRKKRSVVICVAASAIELFIEQSELNKTTKKSCECRNFTHVYRKTQGDIKEAKKNKNLKKLISAKAFLDNTTESSRKVSHFFKHNMANTQIKKLGEYIQKRIHKKDSSYNKPTPDICKYW